MRLDQLDERLLAELDNNARQSNSQIAKRLHVNKNVINYRLNVLEQSGIIRGYYAVIDAYCLGYSSYRIYLKLQHASPKKEQEIIKYLTELLQTRWVGVIKGDFNLGVVFLVRTQEELVEVWNEFNLKFHEYVHESCVGISYGLERYRLPFAKKYLKQRGGVDNVIVGKTGSIDKVDVSLLKLISGNGRMHLLELSKKLNLSPSAVQYRIKQLVGKKIILGFRPILDMEKLGYTLYKIDFNLKSTSAYKKIQEFAKEHDDIFCLVKTIGWADVELEVYSKTTQRFYEILDEIRTKFDDVISDYSFFMYSKIIKFRYTPF